MKTHTLNKLQVAGIWFIGLMLLLLLLTFIWAGLEVSSQMTDLLKALEEIGRGL